MNDAEDIDKFLKQFDTDAESARPGVEETFQTAELIEITKPAPPAPTLLEYCRPVLPAIMSVYVLAMKQPTIAECVTANSPACETCQQAIASTPHLLVSEKAYHTDHFLCGHCKAPLTPNSAFNSFGGWWCQSCYEQHAAPTCSVCRGPIVDKCVYSEGVPFHIEHFSCKFCDKPIVSDKWYRFDNARYCSLHYGPLCGGCSQPIRETRLHFVGKDWHPECFQCRYCRMPLAQQPGFRDFRAEPYCQSHYQVCPPLSKACRGISLQWLRPAAHRPCHHRP